MPPLTRAFVTSALVWLLLALGLGVLIEAPPLPGVPSQISVLFPTWLHLLVVGWLTQLTFGVAYWIFPRPAGDLAPGSEPIGWAVFGLLNGGLLLRTIGEPMVGFGAGGGWLLVLAAVLKLTAGLAFVATIWPRVQSH